MIIEPFTVSNLETQWVNGHMVVGVEPLQEKKQMDYNPTVIITGITGTLGRAVTQALHGWSVIGCSLHGNRDSITATVDVTNPQAVGVWFDTLARQKVNIHALVTCAGIAAVAPITQQKPIDFKHILDTNVTGTWLCIREAVKHGVKRIVTVSSLLGGAPIGYPDRAAYITSKAAVAGMTRALAVELAPQGIAVNCVAPGHYTLMASKAAGLLEGALGRSPMGRLVTPEEVAEVITWLVTDAPECLTGEILVVDGAYSIGAYPVARWWEDGE